MKYILLTTLAVLSHATDAHAATTIYQEDFSSSTILNNSNPYLGGYYGSQVAFGQLAGGSETSITASETLRATTTSGFRGVGVILDPALFSPGSGDYILRYDIVNYSGDANDAATISIWQGSGYDLSESSAQALVLDTEANALTAKGTANASNIGNATHSATGTDLEISFSYDGSSAVALFFGASTAGYPFPEVEYDNISIVSAPEPSSATLLGISLSLLACIYRKRR